MNELLLAKDAEISLPEEFLQLLLLFMAKISLVTVFDQNEILIIFNQNYCLVVRCYII